MDEEELEKAIEKDSDPGIIEVDQGDFVDESDDLRMVVNL